MIKNLKDIVTISLGACILMLISFYNGYPLVYSDTGSYIGSGFDTVIPADRPILYGLFIKAFSFGKSLWLVVLTQNILTAILIYKLFKLFKIQKVHLVYLITISFLTLTTGVAWYSNQIMPDFFTPLLFIAFFLLVFNPNYSFLKKLFLSIVLVFASTTHLSHLFIGILLIISLYVIYFKYRKNLFNHQLPISLKKTIYISLTILSSWVLLLFVNYIVESKPILSKGSHVFLMGNLIDKGILKPFLDENCLKEDFKDCKLCAFKDKLPNNGIFFIWGGEVLEKTGGWIDSREEYNKIIFETYKQPKYLWKNIYKSFMFGLVQLAQNNIGEGLIPYKQGSAPYGQINWRFNNEVNLYLNSKQNNKTLISNFQYLTFFQWIVLSLCSFVIIFLFFGSFYKKITPISLWFLIYTIILIFFNAFVTAGLTAPYARLQSRTIWLFPLAIILLIVSNYRFLLKIFKKDT